MKTFTINRTLYDNATMGEMLLDGKHFGYTLEDKVRGEYVYGETAIPHGRYKLIRTMSNRFKKVMPLLVNLPGQNILFGGRPIQECGVRIHGGNTTADTHGCPLLGMETDPTNKTIRNCAYTNIELNDILSKATLANEDHY
jgi:hypothetical protein